jgi:hypothetical protein
MGSRLLSAAGAGFIARLAVLGLCVSSCATVTAPPASSPPVPAAALGATGSAPEWRPGDRWVYGWTSGSDTGTKTVEVVEIREISEVPFYLVRVGDLVHFYTRELQWAGTMRELKVESRMKPPQPWFVWPLEAGARWTHRATYEDANGKTEIADRFSVVATETVEVPAGRFNAVKVVRETDRRDVDEYWYAPEVRFYVKWVGRRGDFQFEEQLREYRQAPRLIPGPPSSAPPSPTK